MNEFDQAIVNLIKVYNNLRSRDIRKKVGKYEENEQLGVCPCCKALMSRPQNYCGVCGQALEWEDGMGGNYDAGT